MKSYLLLPLFLINRENITHFCGAPIILQMIINELKKIKIKNKVKNRISDTTNNNYRPEQSWMI